MWCAELWDSRVPITFEGKHIHVRDALLTNHPDPVPPVYFGGSSAAAGEVAGRYADAYLTWGEPPATVNEKLERIHDHPRTTGELSYGVRIHEITRDTAAEAWAVADRLLSGLDPADIQRVQANLARSESEGQRRMVELHSGGLDRLEVAPNLWAGVGLVRGGAGTALVGSHTEVAERLVEYSRLGIT